MLRSKEMRFSFFFCCSNLKIHQLANAAVASLTNHSELFLRMALIVEYIPVSWVCLFCYVSDVCKCTKNLCITRACCSKVFQIWKKPSWLQRPFVKKKLNQPAMQQQDISPI